MRDILTLEKLRQLQQEHNSKKAQQHLLDLADSDKNVSIMFAMAFGNPHKDPFIDYILTTSTLPRRWKILKAELEENGYDPLDFAMMQSNRISDVMKEEIPNLVCDNFGINTSCVPSVFNSEEIQQIKTKKLKNN